MAQIIFNGSQVVGRAFLRAIRQEIEASQRAAKARSQPTANKSAADTVTGMSVQEALQVLDVKEITNMEAIKTNYEHLFEVNGKAKGGSLYLQSKVVRAKERILQELSTFKPEVERT